MNKKELEQVNKEVSEMKRFFKQLCAYLKPIKGHGTIGMFQRTIVYSEWVLILSVVISIALECINKTHGGWIHFFENFAIGIACSDVVVLVTTITQFKHIRNEKFEDYNSTLFQFFVVLTYIVDIKKSGTKEELSTNLKYMCEDIHHYSSLAEELFWFKLKYNVPFHQLSLKLRVLMLNLEKEYPPKDLYVGEKEIDSCIKNAKEFMRLIKPHSFNLLDFFNVEDKKQGENNDQL